MKIELEIDKDGNFKASCSQNVGLAVRSFSASGKIALEEEEQQMYRSLKDFVRGLESYCPKEYNYHSNNTSKIL